MSQNATYNRTIAKRYSVPEKGSKMKRRRFAIVFSLIKAIACFAACSSSEVDKTVNMNVTPVNTAAAAQTAETSPVTTVLTSSPAKPVKAVSTETRKDTEKGTDDTKAANVQKIDGTDGFIDRYGVIEYDTSRKYKMTDGKTVCDADTYSTKKLDVKRYEEFLNVVDDSFAYMLIWDGNAYMYNNYYILVTTEDGSNWNTIYSEGFSDDPSNDNIGSGTFYSKDIYASVPVKSSKETKAFKTSNGGMVVFTGSYLENHTCNNYGDWISVKCDEDHKITLNTYKASNWYKGFTISDGTVLTGDEYVSFDLSETGRTDAAGNPVYELDIYGKYDNAVLFSGPVTIDPETLKPVPCTEKA